MNNNNNETPAFYLPEFELPDFDMKQMNDVSLPPLPQDFDMPELTDVKTEDVSILPPPPVMDMNRQLANPNPIQNNFGDRELFRILFIIFHIKRYNI